MSKIINEFVWKQWCISSKVNLKKALDQITLSQIREIAKSHIKNLRGNKLQVIKKILEYLF